VSKAHVLYSAVGLVRCAGYAQEHSLMLAILSCSNKTGVRSLTIRRCTGPADTLGAVNSMLLSSTSASDTPRMASSQKYMLI
jgi:hypothetical protein